MGNFVTPGSCLLSAPGLFSAAAPGFPMTIQEMNTRGSKISNSSATSTGFSLDLTGLAYNRQVYSKVWMGLLANVIS